ncbi:MAG: MBL fold metallo-hydrolase, partial [Muribaculaceae bacterium]
SKGLKVKYILLTHAHLDHAAAAEDLAKKYGVEVYANMSDAELAQNLPDQAMRFRLPVNLKPLKFDKFLNDGDILMLGDERIEVIATPGHSMGGLMYYVPESGFACVGDTIFQGSIGRTDLPGGDFYTLINAIKEKVFSLPDETVLFSGHGPSTTVLREKQMNPYVR